LTGGLAGLLFERARTGAALALSAVFQRGAVRPALPGSRLVSSSG
jgi:hypothetical protein